MAGSQGHCSWAGLNPCGTALLPQHKELCSLRLSEFTEGGRAGRGLQLSVVQDEPKESCGFIPFLEASMLHEPYVMPSSPIPFCNSWQAACWPWRQGTLFLSFVQADAGICWPGSSGTALQSQAAAAADTLSLMLLLHTLQRKESFAF